MSNLYLVSTELREPYKPRACQIIKKLASETRNDLALVKVTPPLPKEIYDSSEDIDDLILAARQVGSTLFPMSNLPIAVYICQSRVPLEPDSDRIDSEHLAILDWGELRQGLI